MSESQNSIGNPEESVEESDSSTQLIPKLSKPEIEGLVSTSSTRLSFTKKANQSSDVWKTFESILVDEVIQNYVRCGRCKSILSYTAETGTSSLRRHVNSCGAASS